MDFSIAHAWWTYSIEVFLSALAVLGARWLARAWISQILNRNLEQFKREQQQELEQFKGEQVKEVERLRHRLTSRISKIHEQEFIVLPKAWLMVNDLRGAVIRALDLTMKTYPDFEGFSDAKFESLLDQPAMSFLEAYQKDELRQTNIRDRGKYYMDALKSSYLNEAHEKLRLLTNYLIEHRIFMTRDLRDKFSAAQEEFSNALTRYSVGRGRNDEMVLNAQKGMLEPGIQQIIDDVEKAVQARLRVADAE